MAYQLSDIITKVKQRVRDTGYSSLEITNYINDTQNDVFNEYNLPFMEATQDYTLTIDDADITSGAGLPSNFVQATNVILTDPAYEKRLIYIPYRELDERFPDSQNSSLYGSSIPNYWYDFASTIYVHARPSSALGVTLHYYKKPTTLSGDSDVPEIPSEFEELLVAGASYRVLQVKDNYDQASIHQNKYDELLDKLVKRYSQRQTGQANRIRINRRAPGKTNF